MKSITRTYSELITIPTFEERYEYLRLDGKVGRETFGYDRYLNQAFYNSGVWKRFRRDIIIRDLGCDLGIKEFEIQGKIIVHHLNPICVEDVINGRYDVILNPDNVICTSGNTHEAIHYGDRNLLITTPIERSKNDTCPWR